MFNLYDDIIVLIIRTLSDLDIFNFLTTSKSMIKYILEGVVYRDLLCVDPFIGTNVDEEVLLDLFYLRTKFDKIPYLKTLHDMGLLNKEIVMKFINNRRDNKFKKRGNCKFLFSYVDMENIRHISLLNMEHNYTLRSGDFTQNSLKRRSNYCKILRSSNLTLDEIFGMIDKGDVPELTSLNSMLVKHNADHSKILELANMFQLNITHILHSFGEDFFINNVIKYGLSSCSFSNLIDNIDVYNENFIEARLTSNVVNYMIAVRNYTDNMKQRCCLSVTHGHRDYYKTFIPDKVFKRSIKLFKFVVNHIDIHSIKYEYYLECISVCLRQASLIDSYELIDYIIDYHFENDNNPSIFENTIVTNSFYADIIKDKFCRKPTSIELYAKKHTNHLLQLYLDFSSIDIMNYSITHSIREIRKSISKSLNSNNNQIQKCIFSGILKICNLTYMYMNYNCHESFSCIHPDFYDSNILDTINLITADDMPLKYRYILIRECPDIILTLCDKEHEKFFLTKIDSVSLFTYYAGYSDTPQIKAIMKDRYTLDGDPDIWFFDKRTTEYLYNSLKDSQNVITLEQMRKIMLMDVDHCKFFKRIRKLNVKTLNIAVYLNDTEMIDRILKRVDGDSNTWYLMSKYG